MSRQRFIALAAAALLAIVGALYVSTRHNSPQNPNGAALLPYLADTMDTVSELSIRKGGATPSVTVQKNADRWTVKERGDYPADVPKLRKLLLALHDAQIVEEKTSNPANFPLIGVEDPAAGAGGAQISMVAKDGTHAVIVGKASGEGSFARRGGENTSYLVEPAITIEAEPRLWIDAHLLDIGAAAIQSVEIKPASGSPYAVRRTNPKEGIFTLEGLPAGRKALDAAALAPSPTAFSALTAEDVAPASDIDFSMAAVATVTLSDGDVITLTGASSGDKHWVQIKSSKEASPNAKTGRAFELTGYRYDAIFRPLEQLLVPKEPPAGAKKTTPAAGPVSSGNASRGASSPALRPVPTKKLPSPTS